MKLAEVRNGLEHAREFIAAGDSATAIKLIDQALGELAPRRLVTSEAAAELLGIRDELIVRLLCRAFAGECLSANGHTLIPLATVERLSKTPEVEQIRIADAFHDASEAFGSPDGLTQEEMDELEASRPGRWPWQVKQYVAAE